MSIEEEFISKIAPLVQKYAPQYGRAVCSPIIAQACLESGYGTSNKVRDPLTGEWRHNYFGLKWRNGRCTITNDHFVENTSEYENGVYVPKVAVWMKFKSLEECVIGYLQWTNISAYKNLQGVTDPRTYLENIKKDKYATGPKYVQNNMDVIEKWNLTQYDKLDTSEEPTKIDTDKEVEDRYYRVQCGAYHRKENAELLQLMLSQFGYKSILKHTDEYYKVQLGAYKNKSNAEQMLKKLKGDGFNCFIVYH